MSTGVPVMKSKSGDSDRVSRNVPAHAVEGVHPEEERPGTEALEEGLIGVEGAAPSVGAGVHQAVVVVGAEAVVRERVVAEDGDVPEEGDAAADFDARLLRPLPCPEVVVRPQPFGLEARSPALDQVPGPAAEVVARL